MTTAILDSRPAVAPDLGRKRGAATGFERLFTLDTLPAHRTVLTCRWRRNADGRLSALWEPDIVLTRI
ncbi:MAG: hypothetical protein JO255_05985, partial [Alphaproteobacteria bacterium]|nr:hypothetical protein [Alphaproteobacteria bacterium]